MPDMVELADAVHAAMEPPLEKKEPSKRDAETLRRNIELFVDGVMMEDRYALAELLNESFTMDMLDLLFKRMTAKLRMILFARPKVHEFIRIALDPTLPRHTRHLATSFLVVGGAMNNTPACPDGDHKCQEFWDAVFGAMLKEARAQTASTTASAASVALPTSQEDAAVAELVELIQVEVQAIEHHGAQSLERSVAERQTSQEHEDDEDDRHSLPDVDAQPPTPTSARTSEQSASPASSSSSPVAPTLNGSEVVGLYSEDTANFSSQILRYFAIRGNKGSCILQYLAKQPPLVDMLLANIGHDDTRTLLLHLIYADHSDVSIAAIFESRIIDLLIERLVSFGPPRNAFERDRVENSFLLLREIIHAPYLTGRGVAISAKTIPIDKVTGQDEYVSICGASREMANSSLRKYTSRKVRHVVHLFMQQNQIRIEQLFTQMIQELTFWSSPVARERERRNSLANLESLESLSLVGMGHPRPVCTATLTHLFELTETVDFSEEHTKKAGPNAAAATTVGIDCLNFMCSTHLVRTGTLVHKKKLRNDLQQCQLSVNCMMGLRITSIREDQLKTPTALDAGFVHNKGNQVHITLDEIDRVASSDWHKHGFVVTVKKRANFDHEMGIPSSGDQVTTTEEYFAAPSEEEKNNWITLLQQVIDGDLTALEIFCSDDWRSNVREYRRLRECLITSMELKGHEIMVFLKQVIILNERKASGFHMWTIVKFLNAVLSNESKRLDQMFVSSKLLRVLIVCYEKYPMMNLLLGEITKMMIFCFGDFKNKRSRRCPIIGILLLSESPEAKLLPLLTKAFVGTDGGKTSEFAGTDTLSELKLLMESIMLCYKNPKSRSQERVQQTLRDDPAWQTLIQAVEQECTANPSRRITSVPAPPTTTSTTGKKNSTPMSPVDAAIAAAPTQPAFQEDIINQITRPCYFSAHGLGSSFLLGDGCAFGYMFKERQGGAKWQKVLLVYEYVSYKLWYFYPSEVDEAHHIQWKWIVPVSVRTRYTHGHDETHSSVGHHGLYVTAYDHHNEGGSLIHHDTPAGTRELHFSVTKLEDRDQWKDVLSQAAKQIQQLAKDYVAMKARLKKPDKKSITHCQDASCGQAFKLLRRPHACKRCAKWFCSKCSADKLPIPEFGLLHPVRHCRACFAAAGGLEATKEPTKLFGTSNRPSSKKNLGLLDDVGAITNHELYELAHGMVSPRSLLQMRRRLTRLDSIDSPTSGFRVDEIDGELTVSATKPKQFFGDDYREAEPNELSPYGSPPPASYLLASKEDTRG